MTSQRTSEEDAFLAGFHDIPSTEELSAMSFVQLASKLAHCKVGSAKFIIIENAMLRHEESAQRNNTILGAKVGGLFTIAGVVIGGILALLASMNQPPNIIPCQYNTDPAANRHNEQSNAVPIPKPPAKTAIMTGSKKMDVPPPPIEANGKKANGNK